LDDVAARRGTKVNVILNEAIDRFLGGQKRGRGARSEALQSVDRLLHHGVLDLARYEHHLAKLVTAVSATGSFGDLVQAEALDNIESLLRALLSANAQLRRDMFEALKCLRAARA
jgi:hypothetical protein